MKKWIQIWYSWGDRESPVAIPEGVDPWEYMEHIVAKEMFISQEDYPHGCTMYADMEQGKVELKYHSDGGWCYYLITNEEDYDPFGAA
jgi:hypothetical protein